MDFTRRQTFALGLLALGGCAADRPGVARDFATPILGSPTPSQTPTPSPAPAVNPETIARKYAAAKPSAWGLNLPGIVTKTELPTVALTFDACGGPGGTGFDADLIAELRRTQTKATIFLNGRWLAANPRLASELAKDPLFEIGNHGTEHRPLSVTGRAAYGIAGTASAQAAVAEVWDNHERLTQLLGQPPKYFRSGTAHYDDIGVQIVRDLGEIPVNFSINGDAGATANRGKITQTVAAARPGDIVIGHCNRPAGATAEGFAEAIKRLRNHGIEFGFLG